MVLTVITMMMKTKKKKKKTTMTMTMTMIKIIIKSSLEPLLVRKNSFLDLHLGIDIVNGARCINVQVDGLACEHLGKDLLLGGDIDDEDEDEDEDEDDI